MIRTPYQEGRIIYGVVQNKPREKENTKPAVDTGRKRKRGIFTKQSGGIGYEH